MEIDYSLHRPILFVCDTYYVCVFHPSMLLLLYHFFIVAQIRVWSPFIFFSQWHVPSLFSFVFFKPHDWQLKIKMTHTPKWTKKWKSVERKINLNMFNVLIFMRWKNCWNMIWWKCTCGIINLNENLQWILWKSAHWI